MKMKMKKKTLKEEAWKRKEALQEVVAEEELKRQKVLVKLKRQGEGAPLKIRKRLEEPKRKNKYILDMILLNQFNKKHILKI